MVNKHLLQVVADRPDIYIVKQPHHLLGEPDIFIGVNGFDATLAAGRHKGQVFRRRRANQGDGGALFGATVWCGFAFAHGAALRLASETSAASSATAANSPTVMGG